MTGTLIVVAAPGGEAGAAPTPPGLYCRNSRGNVVHRRDCRRKGQAVQWRYVDGKTHGEVLDVIAQAPWLRACTVCMTASTASSTEQLELGQTLRAAGAAAADAVQPEQWRAQVDTEIRRLAKTGRPFVADDVSAVTGDSPTGSRGAMGARFQAAAHRGVIRRVGYVPSRRASVHAHPVAQWVGVEQPEPEKAGR